MPIPVPMPAETTECSIRLISEAAGLSPPTSEVAASIGLYTDFKLRQIISKAIQFMKHSNRSRLSCVDINKALRWLDCQPVFGYESNQDPAKIVYSTEARVYRYEENVVDLENRSKQTEVLDETTIQEAKPELVIQNLDLT